MKKLIKKSLHTFFLIHSVIDILNNDPHIFKELYKKYLKYFFTCNMLNKEILKYYYRKILYKWCKVDFRRYFEGDP